MLNRDYTKKSLDSVNVIKKLNKSPTGNDLLFILLFLFIFIKIEINGLFH